MFFLFHAETNCVKITSILFTGFLGGTIMDTLSLTLRQRKLLHILQSCENLITGSELASQLNTTARTIRSDIAAINLELKPFNAKIDSIRSKGYFFTAENGDKIRELNRINTAFFTRDDRIRYLAFQLCLTDTPISVYDLEDEMFISHTTLENDIHTLKLLYMLKSPFINITNRHSMLSFEPDERKRRHILTSLIHRHWNYNSRENAIYENEYVSEEILDQMIDIVSQCLHKHRLRMEDTNIVWLNIACTIMYERLSSGYMLPQASPVSKPDASALAASNEILATMERLFSISIPPQEYDEIYLLISSAHILDPSKITLANTCRIFDASVLDMAAEYMELLQEFYHLDFSTDEDFYLTLLQYIRFILAPVHRFSTQENPSISKSHLITELELAWAFQSIALKHAGYYLNEEELLHLAYCISGALEFHFELHPEYKLSTVICCHEHMTVAWSIKRKLLGAYEKYLKVTALIPVNQAKNYDFSDTDLILLTVHKKISDETLGKIIEISPYISPNDIRKLETYLQSQKVSFLYRNTGSVRSFFETAYWHEDYEFDNIFSAVETLGSEFVDKGIAGREYLSALLQRESLCSNAYCSGLLFQFAMTPAKQTQLSFTVLPRRMNWRNHKIRVIVTAAFTAADRTLVFKLKHFFYRLNKQCDITNAVYSKDELLQLLTAQPDAHI